MQSQSMMTTGHELHVATSQNELSAPRKHSPLISIVVLNYKGRQDTLSCLDSFRHITYRPFNVIVVDNASNDGIACSLSEHSWPFPLHVIENVTNLGYAGGNNVGMRHALQEESDYVLVLNNDTEIASNMLEELLAATLRWPDSAIFGPRIYYFDRKDTVWSNGDVLGPRGTGFRSPGQGKRDHELLNDEISTDSIVGAALFFSANLLNEIGYFDERFFLHYEDHDFCARARTAGYGCRVVPAAKMWHKVGASIGPEESPLVRYVKTRNRLLFAEKHLARGPFIAFLTKELVHLAPPLVMSDDGHPWFNRLMWAGREWLRRSLDDPLYQARRRGLRDYLVRRFGNVPERILEINRAWATHG